MTRIQTWIEADTLQEVWRMPPTATLVYNEKTKEKVLLSLDSFFSKKDKFVISQKKSPILINSKTSAGHKHVRTVRWNRTLRSEGALRRKPFGTSSAWVLIN